MSILIGLFQPTANEMSREHCDVKMGKGIRGKEDVRISFMKFFSRSRELSVGMTF